MKPYSKDMAGWDEVLMLAVILVIASAALGVVELFRFPGRVWRWIK